MRGVLQHDDPIDTLHCFDNGTRSHTIRLVFHVGAKRSGQRHGGEA